MKAYFPNSDDYFTEDAKSESWDSETLHKSIGLDSYEGKHGTPWNILTQIVQPVTDAGLNKWVDITCVFSESSESTIYNKAIVQINGEGHNLPGAFFISDFKLNE